MHPRRPNRFPASRRKRPPGESAGFLSRAVIAFASVGISVERVFTDNSLNYHRSTAFIATAEELGIGRSRTRPTGPQTNGKAEAFNKTLQREWAYRHLYTTNAECLDALQTFLDDYNFARPPYRQPPARLTAVSNPHENYT